jgi:hypothetical protein
MCSCCGRGEEGSWGVFFHPSPGACQRLASLMAAQGEGATQLGVCVLCGEELDLHEAQLVEVRCNKHKHGCDDQVFHSDCVIDLIDRRAGSRRCVRVAQGRRPLDPFVHSDALRPPPQTRG